MAEEVKKEIKNITITPGCVSCGSCEAICPEVFELNEIASVKKASDLSNYSELIQEAANMCPVGVIAINTRDTSNS